ncbi:MEDS domain-containing protein [Allorhizocola rhizosphaerae]|uniref:MEDS domain-containing protein n=1 Tax=Allorhizocola rhizosphaerae TaxID=1872709 RepID=UPI000E3ED902|nr:MEDS domain-containing protein [Allorhizocola rhizosphaerae]
MIAEIVDRVRLGDHVCAFAAGADDLVDAAAAMIGAGLRSGEQVLVFTGSLVPAELRAGLQARGLDVDAAARAGSVRLIPAQQAFLPDGRFDPRRTLDRVGRYVDDAAAGGYTGLRMLRDIAWTPYTPADAEQLTWFEAQLNTIYMEARALGVCLYDPSRLDRGVLQRVISAHPTTSRAPANGAGWSPLLQIRRTMEPHGLQLIGECDFSNRRAVRAAVDAALRDRPAPSVPIVIDVSQLTFADAATGALLLGHAWHSPPNAAIVGVTGTLATVIRLLGGPNPPNVQFGS